MTIRRDGNERVLLKSMLYNHPVDAVWCALTDPRALAEWLMPNDFEPRVGHRFVFKTDPMKICGGNGVTECEVLELEAPRRMVWSWQQVPVEGKAARPPMRIEWRLAPEGDGTRLVLEQRGLEGQGWLIPRLMNFGWGGMMSRFLRKVLRNVRAEGGAYRFEPGAIPLAKRTYKATTVEARYLGG